MDDAEDSGMKKIQSTQLIESQGDSRSTCSGVACAVDDLLRAICAGGDGVTLSATVRLRGFLPPQRRVECQWRLMFHCAGGHSWQHCTIACWAQPEDTGKIQAKRVPGLGKCPSNVEHCHYKLQWNALLLRDACFHPPAGGSHSQSIAT